MRYLAAEDEQEAAETVCRGIVVGLLMAKEAGIEEGPLCWAPDFAAEEARHVLNELLEASPPGKKRKALCGGILEKLATDVPAWHEMLNRALRTP